MVVVVLAPAVGLVSAYPDGIGAVMKAFRDILAGVVLAAVVWALLESSQAYWSDAMSGVPVSDLGAPYWCSSASGRCLRGWSCCPLRHGLVGRLQSCSWWSSHRSWREPVLRGGRTAGPVARFGLAPSRGPISPWVC